MNMKIFIASPMYGGQCFSTFANSLFHLGRLLSEHDIECSFNYVANDSLIARARNTLANQFLNSDSTHLLFIDADIGFNPVDVLKMIEEDKDIVGGIYPKKRICWDRVEQSFNAGITGEQLEYYTGDFCVKFIDDETEVTINVDEAFEVAAVATGFLLIKKEVFIALKDYAHTYIADYDLRNFEYLSLDSKIYEFFRTGIDSETNQYIGEDYYFCKLARNIGFKIYAVPYANFTHSGFHRFSGAFIT